MPRTARQAPGGYLYHVLNRGVGRMTLFERDADYDAFERAMADTLAARPMRVVGYCLMPNHWHLLLWPRRDGDLSAFMQRLTITHVRRWIEHRHAVGCGHVYQGRYKSFPCQDDRHGLTVLRYIERNPLRAGLVARAEEWRWSSLGRRLRSGNGEDVSERPELTDPPMDLPPDLRTWARTVNAAESETELTKLRLAVSRGRPVGSANWVERTTRALGLESAFRPRGRPRREGGDE